MLLLVVYLLLALCVSFFCSLLEAVLVSTPLSHVETLKNDIRDAISKGEYGRKERRRLCSVLIFENAKNHIDKSLSALLSLNTVAHTVGAAGAGVQSAKVFGDTYVGIIVAVLSFLILVLSEILPQSIGLRYWRKLCLPTGRIIRLNGSKGHILGGRGVSGAVSLSRIHSLQRFLYHGGRHLISVGKSRI